MVKLTDLDGNGVADYREPWFWRAVWGIVAWGVKTFAPAHTIAARAVAWADETGAVNAGLALVEGGTVAPVPTIGEALEAQGRDPSSLTPAELAAEATKGKAP